MMIQRMEHVGIVVDDLAAATAFFVELGLKVQVEGGWVDRVVAMNARHCPRDDHSAGEEVGGRPEPSTDLLRQLDDDPLRAADIALHLANELRAAGSQAKQVSRSLVRNVRSTCREPAAACSASWLATTPARRFASMRSRSRRWRRSE